MLTFQTGLAFLSLQCWVLRTAASPSISSSHSVRSRANNGPYFDPKALHLGSAPSNLTVPFSTFTLNPSNSMVTLDYGFEVAGYPYFEVVALAGKVQIEVKYSEPLEGLSRPYSDGPFVFGVGLSNSFRVETFEITKPGSFQAFLIQGGQRWQSIKLITSGSVTFSRVALQSSITPIDVDNLPGQFSSNDSLANDIWKLGARAVSAACVQAGTQRAIWEISETDGAFVRGMRTALSTRGQAFKDYTLNFSSKIVRGGTGWAVAFPISSLNGGIQLSLIGSLPVSTTFVNTDTSLIKSNSVLLAYGWTYVNQTTNPSYYLDTFRVPFPIHEEEWYTITTVLRGGEYVAVAVNGTQLFNVSLNDYYTGLSSDAIKTEGTFGFGPYQDQAAYIKDVTVHDSANGSILYSNPMTEVGEVLPEYGVDDNYASVCLDGPKRDRLVWLGDFYHTVRIIDASTGRQDYIKGTLQNFIDWQLPNGQFPIDPPMGYPSSASPVFAQNGFYALADYQILGLIAFISYIDESNDLAFARSSWPAFKSQISWLILQINSTTGLAKLPGFTFIGPGDGSAVNCALVQGLKGAAEIATAIGDFQSTATYQSIAEGLSKAINKDLWNDGLGIYSIAASDSGNFSVAGLSFAITSGVASPTRATAALSHLSSLKLWPGYKDSSKVSSSDITANISPNINGFLLDALFQVNQTTVAMKL